MSFWRALRRPSRVLLPIALALLLPLSSVSAASDEGSGAASRNYIVTLSVVDAGKAIRPTGRSARQRIRRRAARTVLATDRLAREGGFRTRNRYRFAISGFSARLTPRQAARLRRDPQVASIRPARRFKVAGQVVPSGIKRTRAAPASGPAAPDIDADIAILDTGIGPVGNNELNVQGGKNCSGDGLGDDAWQDVFSARHGTHVAGIAAARDNDIGVVGVAPGARLWSVRVFRSSGFGDESTIVCGLDWAVSTRGPGAPPGTQPIEVINMSIQGPRVSGAPEACVGASDRDPIHAAVCAATAAGITVVVAAGNDGSNTDQVSPAGYDQVITVAALSDFDGLGDSQGTTACEFFEQEIDDSYARYSNYGDDVDIVAPGTCITSTFPSASGDETQVLTGTSMATPHVTGAVARYLATNPATTPSRMRKLIRASGRLDWKMKTDPQWSGVNDTDAPNRVLDVKALLGTPSLRAWVSSASLKIGGTDTTRAVRVDVQRIGGYDGDVQLGVAGLPGDVGTATFDRPGASLSGLGGLGARLRLTIKQSSPSGNMALQVKATAPGGNPAASRDLGLLVDRSAPVSTALAPRLRGGRAALPKGGATVALFGWTVGDALSKVKSSSLQRKVGSGPWKGLGRRNKNKLVATIIKPGKAYRFRVRSSDSFGNVGNGVSVPVRMIVRSANSTKWLRPASGWVTRTSSKALRGSRLAGTKGTGKLSTAFDGTAVAIVAPLGPKRGKIRVRVDGGKWQPVNLKAAKGANRRVVFSRRLAAGSHELEIQVRSGQAAIDAILILR